MRKGRPSLSSYCWGNLNEIHSVMDARPAVLREDTDLINGPLPPPRVRPVVRQAHGARHIYLVQPFCDPQSRLIGMND